MMRTVNVYTLKTERGWEARCTYYGLGAEGGATEDDAVDAVYGAALIAIGQSEHPPREIRCVVHSAAASKGTNDDGWSAALRFERERQLDQCAICDIERGTRWLTPRKKVCDGCLREFRSASKGTNDDDHR